MTQREIYSIIINIKLTTEIFKYSNPQLTFRELGILAQS